MAAIRWAGPAEIARKMEAAGEPAPKDDSESGGSLLRQAVARRDAQLLAKPADYVLKNPRVADLYQAMKDPVPLPTDAAAPAAASPGRAEPMNKDYPSLPERNVKNTITGYNLVLDGKLKRGYRQVVPDAIP